MQTELQKSTDRAQLQMGDIFFSEDTKDTNLIPTEYRQSLSGKPRQIYFRGRKECKPSS